MAAGLLYLLKYLLYLHLYTNLTQKTMKKLLLAALVAFASLQATALNDLVLKMSHLQL